MSREQAFLHMLDAASKIQWNIAMILEAKAVEAEKIRNWTLNHLNSDAFSSHENQLSEPLQIHGQIVELLEGLTKMENGLCSNLKALLVQEEEEYGGAGGGGEGMYGSSGGDFSLGDMGK
ncbi:restriction endonuclease subunit S [Paenibacillus sp. XY044]|uniref:restriction endonuclease subunit S n=1 Tax=Paenibacillus sp. XY044 TaxID=2026089 RepID=UPI000B97F0DA|nr:restriction endonuclease subunit S [Paenibacillus sp. XY044]OZB91037.1 restriction endonuclease subunit S [Paenibacillus sp. XY044]